VCDTLLAPIYGEPSISIAVFFVFSVIVVLSLQYILFSLLWLASPLPLTHEVDASPQGAACCYEVIHLTPTAAAVGSSSGSSSGE
jgi:hypothetical protein